jgi:hypothetical protein
LHPAIDKRVALCYADVAIRYQTPLSDLMLS